MAKEKANKTLRFDMRVSLSNHPALFSVLNDAGPYRMSKRMIDLALSGLMVERGGERFSQQSDGSADNAVAEQQKLGSGKTSKRNKPKSRKEELGKPAAQVGSRYTIPDGADDAINNLFETMV